MRRGIIGFVMSITLALFLPVYSFADTFKARPGTGFLFQANDGGGYVDKLAIGTDGKVTFEAAVVERIENSSGGTPPGMVPIGGMVAVMPNVTGAWQPPASGAIKDGFMRADGSTVNDSGSPLNGQTLPNMVNKMARGSTDSSTSGGNDSVTLVEANIPSHTHSSSGITAYMSATDFEHSHSWSGYTTAANFEHSHSWSGYMTAANFEHSHVHNFSVADYSGTKTSTTSVARSDHKHNQGTLLANIEFQSPNIVRYRPASGSWQATEYTTTGNHVGTTTTRSIGVDVSGDTGTPSLNTTVVTSINHGHTLNGGIGADTVTSNKTVTGSVGADNVSSNKTVTGSVGADDVSSNKTVTLTGSTGSYGGSTAVDTLPAYQSVVWVVRVK